MAQSTQNYSKPQLRERIKKKVMAGTKGGRAGQWSARKAQLVAAEYEKQGGGYKGKKTKSAKHLEGWTKEKWRTTDKKKAQRKSASGKTEMARYLPSKAWSKLTASEKKSTDAKKRAGSKKGKQYVSNTKAAKKARATSRHKKSRAKS